MTVYIGDDPALPVEWTTAPAQCLSCGHTWIAVFPLFASDLECPQCNSTDTVRGDEHEQI